MKEVDDDKARFAILNHFLDGFKGTIFRQAQFAEFEDMIHKADQAGEVLTSEYLNNLYADLNENIMVLARKTIRNSIRMGTYSAFLLQLLCLFNTQQVLLRQLS